MIVEAYNFPEVDELEAEQDVELEVIEEPEKEEVPKVIEEPEVIPEPEEIFETEIIPVTPEPDVEEEQPVPHSASDSNTIFEDEP
jgi:hypothetical protein